MCDVFNLFFVICYNIVTVFNLITIIFILSANKCIVHLNSILTWQDYISFLLLGDAVFWL